MVIFAVQYLENPYPDATPARVRRRLRQAVERLPINFVLLGWELIPAIEEAVAEETTRQHARLYRWQPLLTGDAHTDLPPEWAVYGADGNPIPDHAGMAEFTFICPNRSAVADFLSERVESAAASGLFQGLFLDRIRFPSPSLDPRHALACFCKHCTRLAADMGLDLGSIRQSIPSLSDGTILQSLLGHSTEAGFSLESFLDFRSASITRTVQRVAKQAQALNLSIGLDCYSPALTRMVGQDLSELDSCADWIKIMTYPRVFGPAGISFELLGLADWLIQHGMAEPEAMQELRQASGLPVPGTRSELSRNGLASETIAQEIRRGYEQGVTKLLAGTATVGLENIHRSTPEQIQADLEACRSADGLVISWDLWLTPLAYFDRIQTLWS